MAKKRSESTTSLLSGVAEALQRSMHKKFKDSPVTINTFLTDDNPTTIKRWVSTGCSELDLAISNIDNGGLPFGRLTIFYGPEQSGKSLIAQHVLANTQKMGGVAIYVDAEYAFHEGFAKAVGIDVTNKDTWIHITENKLEKILTLIEDAIALIREKSSDIPITIVLDSMASCITDAEEEKEYGVAGYNTSKSIVMTNALAKLISIIVNQEVCFVVTNQVRSKMNVQMFEDPWRMPGGQALPHYASIIVRLKKSKAITVTNKYGMKREIGREAVAVTEKNRLTSPHIKVTFNIYYDRGIDDYVSLAKNAVAYKIASSKGAWVEYGNIKVNGVKELAKVLKEDSKLRTEIYNKFAEVYKMHYNYDQTELETETIEKDFDADDEGAEA